jgi:hypothetical protein
MIYGTDPDPEPDTNFLEGELRHLVIGNRGRLLDARRTPITITATVPERGAFELEVGAFEDAGARWELPLEDVVRFQFARGGAVAPADIVADLERAVARFDRALVIDCDPETRAETLARVAAERTALRPRLASPDPSSNDVAGRIAGRAGDPRLFGLLEEVMAAHGVTELEHELSAAFVTNPGSGELVKGHAIVLAELGLCPYRGKIARDPALFEGTWSRARRAEHLVARLGFVQELWSSWGLETATLYRGAAADGPLGEPSPASFISATFSEEVAAAHFEGGRSTRTAVLWRQRVPVTRLFMTCLETRALNLRFNEAEALLIADPGNRAF